MVIAFNILAIICLILLVTLVPYLIWHEERLIEWEDRKFAKIKNFFKKLLKNVWHLIHYFKKAK